MGLSLQTWKIVCGVILFVLKLIAFSIVFFLRHRPDSEVIDVTVGAGLTAISLVHILPRAEDFIAGEYPFAALVALVVFTFLTLFTFIRDSLGLTDDTILTTDCDAINRHTTVNVNLLSGRDANESETKFVFAENVPVIFLSLASVSTSIAAGLLLSGTTLHELQVESPHFAIAFLEFIAIARYIALMPIRAWIFWLSAVVLSVIESSLMMSPIENLRRKTLIQYSGYSSSILLGVYLFLGSVAIQRGLTAAKQSWLSALALVLAFGVPMAIPTSLRLHQ